MLTAVYIIYLYLKTAYHVFVVNAFKTLKLIKELNQVLYIYNRQLDDYTTGRIHFYTKQSALTNLWFSTLRGYKPTAEEAKMALYIGALTPLADDLTDELNLSSAEILSKVAEVNSASSDNIILLNYLYKKIKAFKNSDLEIALNEAMNAQNKSIVQRNKAVLDEKSLAKLTKEKGGSATYLYRNILCNNPLTGEKDVIYSLGYVLQLTNDLFDIHKDFTQKQQTLFTNTLQFQLLLNDFRLSIENCTKAFLNLDLPLRNKQRFLASLSLLFARGLVGAEMLENLNNIKPTWQLAEMQRSELICDMEKPANIWLSIRFSIKYVNNIENKLLLK